MQGGSHWVARKLPPLPLFTEGRQETCDLEGAHDSAKDLMPLGLLGLGAKARLFSKGGAGRINEAEEGVRRLGTGN